jgi:hypothetical protein
VAGRETPEIIFNHALKSSEKEVKLTCIYHHNLIELLKEKKTDFIEKVSHFT